MKTISRLLRALPVLMFAAALTFLDTTGTQAQLQMLPGDQAVAPAAGDQTAPAIARGGDTMLVVWTDNRPNPYGSYAWSEYETSRDLYGVRLDLAGNMLDAVPRALVAARSIQNYPKISWNGSNWLVVYQSMDLGGTGYYQDSLEAVRVSPTGQVLDAKPIKLYGLVPSGGSYWTVASDGNNWVVVNQGTSTSGDIVAVRISAAGVLLDPPTGVMVEGTYYMRSNLKLAYAAGVFLLTYDEMGTGSSATSAVRFDSNLSLLSAPFAFNPSPLSALAENGTSFYAVWNRQEPDYSVHVVGSRVSTDGVKLDGNGINISGTKQPYAYAASAVAWDGVNWRVTWGEFATTYVARVTSAGTLLNPGSVAVPGVQTGPTAGSGTGALQMIWTTFANNNNDVFTANISPGNVAGTARTLSQGAPQQLRPDIATSGNGYMLVYRSSTDANSRVLAQPLDAAGNPLTTEPVQLDIGPSVSGPGSPNIAWNGSLYLVSWGTTNGIVAQRLLQSGAKVDAAPLMVMSGAFGLADVAALGDDFLVTGRKVSFSVQYIVPVAARVSGGGAVLDPSPLVLGNSYVATAPAVVALGNRWLVAWHRNATHDDSYALTMGAFVPPAGAPTAEFQIHGPFSTAGGNFIFEVGLGSSGDKALLVQSQELTSGVETDLLGRIIEATGAVGPPINLTPWSGNQYRPRVAWDGTNFIVVYQEQKNRLAPGTLDQLDARSDLYGMRVSPSGTKIDLQGFVFSAHPTGETDPNIAASNGVALLAGSRVANDGNFANYRIVYEIRPTTGPTAVINASTTSGDIPLTVNFDSGAGFGVPLTYAWDFGDGATSNIPNPSHTFTVAGEYLVTLTKTDEFGRQATQAQIINATKPNQTPIAVATANKTSGNTPLDVIFYADGSYDPDGFIGNIEWLFSDGGTYWGSTAYHTFAAVGNHTVTLRVYDSRGAVGITTLVISITGVNQPPIAVASATPSSGNAPLAVQFSSAGSHDPDGTIVAYEWTFGDAFGTHSNEANPTYIYGYAGTYTATLTVWDNNNVSRSANVVVTVNPAPTTVLHSSAINLSAKLQGNKVSVTGNVAVVNGSGAAVGGATVSATWSKPSGTIVTQTATTGANGIAKFSTSGARGTYTLTITNISKTGHTFDFASSIMSNSITR